MQRVSSFGNFQTLIDHSVKLQADVAQQQIRAGSGKKTDKYSEIADSTKLVLDLQQDLALSTQYAENANQVMPQLDTMYSSLTQAADILSSFRATLASGFNGDPNSISGIAVTAQAAQEKMVALLNANVAGNYVFGGTVTDRAPVDMSAYPVQTYPSSANTSYYGGNDKILSFTADTDYDVSYGITADNEAFEQALRAMNMIANLGTYDQNALQEAYDLTSNAIDANAELLAKTSANATSIDEALDMHTEYELFVETLLSDLTDVDAAEATAEMQALQTQLQASYTALSKSLSMSIMDYL
ncbi:flagellin [Aestuariispira insulae]|uniref:Flagellar hook-associated protein 3 FlgL n=1 Tax=Aestuariispira insulae TaxID=1461337 RepID=A0A3D9H5P2_9PROT|nr:flagellin [Aestuariispira insulae]RED44808.1 flagellar hook-associated protein 3 FlgL [Aestuariispira insulae]